MEKWNYMKKGSHFGFPEELMKIRIALNAILDLPVKEMLAL
ncbi:hypothetical protein CHCC5024_0695 [Bacillus licheniformis]|uniref:Uncharacterized protein n=1 Tax=Bacillus licheniformis TaxID=1402 RepID=A0A8B5YDW4_BACLI|nr:hypothetical protein B4164_1007 [Bacillus licheniformis]TWJ47487.1 hypothetical protein CHCC5024_0695 [Bacillus licheniformis]TWL28828.1 hypothetical protein CHCC16736_3430 [Bacillus licheniformis]TWL31096.1 hypothetical protein CHCC15546_0575 [Bacillus licheniformis]TWL39060.1 hypothetical protein CHCC15543_3992 [Bacillus licheniformis]